jgi:hypothetical protein
VTNISGRIAIDCSADDCAHYLDAFVAQRRASAEHSVRLEIGVPVADLALRREVIATLIPRAVGASTSETHIARYDLGWEADKGGPYPAFAGTLTVAPGGDERSTLELAGSYQPPAGIIGQAFDAAMGRRIATATLRALLDTLKEGIDSVRRSAVNSQLDELTRRFVPPSQ